MNKPIPIRTPEQVLRLEWAASLREQMKYAGDNGKGMTRKQLRQKLAERGVVVTHQAVSSWLRGETAPKPAHQVHIAAIFRVPPHRLFPIEKAVA